MAAGGSKINFSTGGDPLFQERAENHKNAVLLNWSFLGDCSCIYDLSLSNGLLLVAFGNGKGDLPRISRLVLHFTVTEGTTKCQHKYKYYTFKAY